LHKKMAAPPDAEVESVIQYVQSATDSMGTAVQSLITFALTYSQDPDIREYHSRLQREVHSYIRDVYPDTSQLMRDIANILRFYVAAEHEYEHFLQFREVVLPRYDEAFRHSEALVATHDAVRQSLTQLRIEITGDNGGRSVALQTSMEIANRQAAAIDEREQESRRHTNDFRARAASARATAAEFQRQAGESTHALTQARNAMYDAQTKVNAYQQSLDDARRSSAGAWAQQLEAQDAEKRFRQHALECQADASELETAARNLRTKAEGDLKRATGIATGAGLAVIWAILDFGTSAVTLAATAASLETAAIAMLAKAGRKESGAQSRRTDASKSRSDSANWSKKATKWKENGDWWRGRVSYFENEISTLRWQLDHHQNVVDQHQAQVQSHQAHMEYYTAEMERLETNAATSMSEAQNHHQQAARQREDGHVLRSRAQRFQRLIVELDQLLTSLDGVKAAVSNLRTFIRRMARTLQEFRHNAEDVRGPDLTFVTLRNAAGSIIATCERYRDLEFRMEELRELAENNFGSGRNGQGE
jgi:chromosome segregation ATPase